MFWQVYFERFHTSAVKVVDWPVLENFSAILVQRGGFIFDTQKTCQLNSAISHDIH